METVTALAYACTCRGGVKKKWYKGTKSILFLSAIILLQIFSCVFPCVFFTKKKDDADTYVSRQSSYVIMRISHLTGSSCVIESRLCDLSKFHLFGRLYMHTHTRVQSFLSCMCVITPSILLSVAFLYKIHIWIYLRYFRSSERNSEPFLLFGDFVSLYDFVCFFPFFSFIFNKKVKNFC